jgi:hypothetical protein
MSFMFVPIGILNRLILKSVWVSEATTKRLGTYVVARLHVCLIRD